MFVLGSMRTGIVQKGEPMSDSIYRHDAIKAIETSRFLVDAIEKVMMLPSAQPKTGKWIRDELYPTYAKCSICGYSDEYTYEDNYCPNCGARMEGD